MGKADEQFIVHGGGKCGDLPVWKGVVVDCKAFHSAATELYEFIAGTDPDVVFHIDGNGIHTGRLRPEGIKRNRVLQTPAAVMKHIAIGAGSAGAFRCHDIPDVFFRISYQSTGSAHDCFPGVAFQTNCPQPRYSRPDRSRLINGKTADTIVFRKRRKCIPPGSIKPLNSAG
jgi:hypothetical protein